MRHLLILTIILAASSVQGQEARPKPTLTAKEVAEGWLLLFDGETTFGLRTVSGKMAVDAGQLELAGSTLHAPRGFLDYDLHFEFHEHAIQPGASVNIGNLGSGLTRHKSFSEKDSRWTQAAIRVLQDKATVAFGPPGRNPDMTFPFDIKRSARIAFAGVAWSVAGGSTLHLRNVKLKPLGLKSIYNGKDLDGWKEFAGKKSRFTVNDQGELNIKDGPGDLQTVGKYKDFILQLECKSNGKHLNSGVFFRCRDNEYQNGYEAQIRNQFTAEPTQEYVLEEYDPKTHELVAKKKARYTAVDYGTGAIYRRQPARKEMSRDGDWFTLTVLAQGNHLATWVNGVQVTDWTDNRPPSDNARTGCRLEAGHISLQGHDPTTDLSFRNFRIAELGQKERGQKPVP